ncbi:hydrophobic surface binding protein A-domain-containing protein [Mycena leptocephala]|nr:hydrophobic surface binding protein A-domain-containing protein [Mycena leptocephala]
MVQLSLVFFSLCLLTTFASPVKRWVVQLENDIRNIGAQITILDNNITAFPSTGPTLVQALVIHTDLTNVETALSTATTDLLATSEGALSEGDAKAVLVLLEAIEPVFLDALSKLSMKAPEFVGTPLSSVRALILQDLKTLQNDTDVFLEGIIAAVPPDLKAEAQAILDAINDGFNRLIPIFASSIVRSV